MLFPAKLADNVFEVAVLRRTAPHYPLFSSAAIAAKSLQSCPTLCDPIDGSPPGSPVPGILQARTLEWVAISFSNAWKWKVKSLSCVWLFRTPWTAAHQAPPMHGIFQARVLEWGAIAFSNAYANKPFKASLQNSTSQRWFHWPHTTVWHHQIRTARTEQRRDTDQKLAT